MQFTSDGTTIESYYAIAGSTIVLPEINRPGYKLKGWTCNGTTYAVGSSVTVSAGMQFVAEWESDTFIFEYVTEGSTEGNVVASETKSTAQGELTVP